MPINSRPHIVGHITKTVVLIASAILLANCGSDDPAAPDPPANRAPVANAGMNQSAGLTDSVMLDGSASSDPDGNSLTYRWSLSSVPAGSAAELSDSTAQKPSFVVDAPGQYVGVLVVSDGSAQSPPDSVVVTTVNSAPVANAGLNRVVGLGVVALDGTKSSDVDGDSLRFNWSLKTVPMGSAAVLSDSTAVSPTFNADSAGTYVAHLVVNDGTLDSDPDSVRIVSDPRPKLTPFSRTIGAGLQFEGNASLEVSNHGGVTMRVESGDTTLALIAPNENTPGTRFVDVVVPDGTSAPRFTVQGVAGTTGTVTITATAPGFADGEGTITVVQPGVAMFALSATQSVGRNRLFTVRTGIPTPSGSGLSGNQGMSAANVPPLVLTVASSNGSVGVLIAGGSPADTVMIPMTAGMFQKNVVFSPVDVGMTTVTASIPGFLSTTIATQDITVDPPDITAFGRTIGAGLQFSGNATLAISNHGGVTVRVESDDPGVALIAPDDSTPGSAFVDVVVTDGIGVVPYTVQGVAGTSGAVTVTVSAPGFDDGTGAINVVLPGIVISGLSPNQTIGADRTFTIFTGIPNGAGTGLNGFQGMSAANVPALVMTVTSTNGTVGQLISGGTTAASVMIEMTAGMFQPNVVFTPLSAGMTTVSATMPGFLTTTGGSVDITVNP